jgi:hypothetical protein
MAMIDERGQLFGRWNVLDLALLVLIVGLIPLGYASYLLFREQPPRLLSVTPNSFEQADEFRLTIKGENLRPYMRLSIGAYQGREFSFKGTQEAEVPFAFVPQGVYDVVLYDQAQERFRLPNAVTITPSGLPSTEVVAIGAFGNLDAAGASKLTPGTELAGAGRILSVGQPAPDVTKVFAGAALVGVPIPNALRLPAAVLFKCYLRSQQGTPYCVINETTVAPPAILKLSTPLGTTPFQVERVRSPQPLQPTAIDIRLTAGASLLSLVKPGDVDLAGTANELALLSRVDRVGSVRVLSPSAAEVEVRLIAQLQKTDEGWLYNSLPLRVGSPFTLRTSHYEVSGMVIGLPPPEPVSR